MSFRGIGYVNNKQVQMNKFCSCIKQMDNKEQWKPTTCFEHQQTVISNG